MQKGFAIAILHPKLFTPGNRNHSVSPILTAVSAALDNIHSTTANKMAWHGKIYQICVVLSGVFGIVQSQCDGSALKLIPKFAENSTVSTINITSPNYPNEYGKDADCTWILNSSEYNVEITYLERKLYYVGSFGRPYCSSSYQIYINGGNVSRYTYLIKLSLIELLIGHGSSHSNVVQQCECTHVFPWRKSPWFHPGISKLPDPLFHYACLRNIIVRGWTWICVYVCCRGSGVWCACVS